jgi:hypothetical protein
MRGPTTIQRRIARNAVIAAIIGTIGGAVAGLWTVGRDASPERPAAEAPVSTATAATTASTEHISSMPSLGKELHRPKVDRQPSAIQSGDDVLQQARALAQRADVRALVALRETAAQRAEERGESTSPTSNPTIAEIDRCLADARLLRLKLDAEEFRTGGTDATRRR